MNNPHGYTYIEIIAAFALFGVLAFLIVMIANPVHQLRRANDDVRVDDVRDIMEIVLEMQVKDPASFAAIVGSVAAGKTMIGTNNSCEGSFGLRCPDDILQNNCIDLAEFAEPGYIDQVPIDPQDKFFDKRITGYYISFEAGKLEIGACNPQSRHEIILTKQY